MLQASCRIQINCKTVASIVINVMSKYINAYALCQGISYSTTHRQTVESTLVFRKRNDILERNNYKAIARRRFSKKLCHTDNKQCKDNFIRSLIYFIQSPTEIRYNLHAEIRHYNHNLYILLKLRNVQFILKR